MMASEPSASESSADSDQDFDPTAEMLVNDFDDEHTLEEEEAMESAESVSNELDDLHREGEMPLSEVLAMYGYESSVDEEAMQEAQDQDSESSVPDSPPHESAESPIESSNHTSDSSTEQKTDELIEIDFDDIPDAPPVAVVSRPLLRSVHQASESSDTGTDYDYTPDEDWRKTIQVGSDYQAVVPDGLAPYDGAPAYENEDRLLWEPARLSEEDVEDYLRQSRLSKAGSGVHAIPTGSHVRDDEQALFLLLQCGYNKEEALRRRRMQHVPPADTMSLWSEDECRSFETGLKAYGKDFHLIQLNKVRTRSVGELVQFYYLWKKTERHDMFASKHRIEKKKYALNPGTTDYMDRFLDEQENPSIRERSSSPNSGLALFGESKKSPLTSPEPNADSSTPEFIIQCLDMDGPSSTSTMSTGTVSTSIEREHLLCKTQSSSDYVREYMNGEDRVSSTTTSPNESNIVCLNIESLTVDSENILNQTDSSISMQINPPSEVVHCDHVMNDIAEFPECCRLAMLGYGKDAHISILPH